MFEMMSDDDHENKNYMNEYAKYSGLIFQMIAMVALGFWGGTKLDQLFNLKEPVFMISLTVCTSFIAIFYMFRTLMKK
jgi:uncharacterized membrane protein